MEFSSSHFTKKLAGLFDIPHSGRQTIAVIILAAIFGMWRSTFGAPSFFDQYLSDLIGVAKGGIESYVYLCVTQCVVGFGLPVFVLTVIFKRRPVEIGLGPGNIKFALMVFALYVPIVTIGGWFLSKQGSFQGMYPMFGAARESRELFLAYEFLLFFYLIGWEYLWRGFLLFGTAPTFGFYSIFIQMLPFAALHSVKPLPEAYLSIIGALLVGLLVWFCRSFWIAVLIHAYQMFIMDFFCSMPAIHPVY